MNFSVLSGRSKHYYPTLCSLCHQPGSASSPLKRCSGCQCFYYCSREHQKQHRRDHRSLCDYIAMRKEDGDPLFGGLTGNTRAEMMKKVAEELELFNFLQILYNPQQIFANPPVCRKTGCFSLVGEIYPGFALSNTYFLCMEAT